MIAVGVSSVKWVGALAAINVRPWSASSLWPSSCWARSRVNRSGDSTMIVRAPLANQRREHAELRPTGDRVGAADRRVIERADDLVACSLGERADRGELPLVGVCPAPRSARSTSAGRRPPS